MESTYERPITLEEELRMKYEAVKRLGSLGYTPMKKGKDILIFAGEDNLGKLTHDEIENVPIAVVERPKFNTNNLIKILIKKRNREVFKETLLELDWQVSTPN